jgi:predicted transcriptional regulator
LTDVNVLLFELSHHDRLEILRQLSQTPMILTRLAEELSLTVQETSRHLSRMEKVGLTEKDVEGLHHASRYGRLVLGQLPALEFSYQNRDYLNSHTLDGLPRELASRIGELRETTLVDDIVLGFNNVGRVVQEAKEYVLSITDQYVVSQTPYFQQTLERGVHMKNIDAPFSVTPAQVPREYRDPDFTRTVTDARKDGRLEERFLTPLGAYIFMSEREVAMLAFPLADGRFDYIGFASQSESTHSWCKDLFQTLWAQATPRGDFLDQHQKWLVATPGAADALRELVRGGKPESRIHKLLEDRGFAVRNQVTFLGRVIHLRLFGD